MIEQMPLRERSKARRRDAIERAALQLFAAKGYDATTVAEIAAAAEVAPRTVSLYFPSKADLVMAHGDAAAERLVAALTHRPEGEPVLDVFGRWLEAEDACTDPSLTALRNAMFEANPSLRAMRTVQTEVALQVGTRAIAEELGLPETHPAVNIALAAAVAILSEYAAVKAAGADHRDVRATALTFLRGGFAAVRSDTGRAAE